MYLTSRINGIQYEDMNIYLKYANYGANNTYAKFRIQKFPLGEEKTLTFFLNNL